MKVIEDFKKEVSSFCFAGKSRDELRCFIDGYVRAVYSVGKDGLAEILEDFISNHNYVNGKWEEIKEEGDD